MSISSFAEMATLLGAGIIFLIFVSKIYDALKNKNVRNALINTARAKDALNATKNYVIAFDIMIDNVIHKRTLYKKVIIALNSSLASSISLIAEQATTTSNKAKMSTTIVGMMLSEKLKKSSRAQLFLITALLANIILDYFFSLPHSGFIFLIVGTGLLGIHIDQKLIEYRIRNGWYGKNEFESREIIDFILTHANKDDFNSSGGLKKIIPTPELPEDEHITIATGATA